jgi:hypothetical protein
MKRGDRWTIEEERALVFVDGTPGGGKTTFIERLVEKEGGRTIRTMRTGPADNGAVSGPIPGGDIDTARHREAGAAGAMRVLVAPAVARGALGPLVWQIDLFEPDCAALVVETDEAPEFPSDLHVHVLSPGSGLRLLRLHGERYGPFAADLVVANCPGPRRRRAVECFAGEIAKMRTAARNPDEPERVPVPVVVADLTDPSDPGLATAIAAVEARLPGRPAAPRLGPYRARRTGPPEQALRVRVDLETADEPMWREFLLPADATFWELHGAIFSAMGIGGDHRHTFAIRRPDAGETIRTEDVANFWETDRLPSYVPLLTDFMTDPHVLVSYMSEPEGREELAVTLREILPVTDAIEVPSVTAGEGGAIRRNRGGGTRAIRIHDPVRALREHIRDLQRNPPIDEDWVDDHDDYYWVVEPVR